MSKFRLDRTAFKAQNAFDAKKHSEYYKHLSLQERLRIANYLNSIAYNYPEENPPRMDKSVFSAKSRNS